MVVGSKSKPVLKSTRWFCHENDIQQTTQVNYRDNNRKTALFFAITYNHWQVVNLLVEHGASLDVRSASGQTPRSMLKAASQNIPERKRKRASPTPDSACPDAPTRIRFALWEWGQEDSDPQIERTADNVIIENAEYLSMRYSAFSMTTFSTVLSI